MNKNKIAAVFPRMSYCAASLLRKMRVRRMKRMTLKERMRYDAELYKKNIGEDLDWFHLRTYTEKMQYAKLFDRDPRKVTLSDKYLVRDWVSEKIGSEYVIPLIGVWDSPDDIDFDQLPQRFVLKTNCGTGDVILVHDRSKLTGKDIVRYKARLKYYQHFDFGLNSCELHYSEIVPKIIAEEILEVEDGEDIPDYKFLCFDGVPYYCWVDVGRYHQHKRNVYDLNWNLQEWNQKEYGNAESEIQKPQNFEKMIDIARTLSSGFSHVRVDLYNIGGKIYFGEMTFTNGSGFENIHPYSANLMLGDLWKIQCDVKGVINEEET